MMATMRSLPRAGDPASMTSIPEAIFHHTTRDTNFPDKHWKAFTSLVVRWRNRNSGGPKNFFFCRQAPDPDPAAWISYRG